MIGALIGTAARAAVTGAVGVAVIGVLKDSKVGDTLRQVAVTVTEAGVRGYKLVESGVEKVVDTATDVYKEAAQRADEDDPSTPTEPFTAAADSDVPSTGVANEAESFLRNNDENGTGTATGSA